MKQQSAAYYQRNKKHLENLKDMKKKVREYEKLQEGEAIREEHETKKSHGFELKKYDTPTEFSLTPLAIIDAGTNRLQYFPMLRL
jgi:hypothetical protein